MIEGRKCIKDVDGYEAKDVKSAVEWLKEELCKNIKPYNRNGMLKTIDKAFEDVTKTKSNKEKISKNVGK